MPKSIWGKTNTHTETSEGDVSKIEQDQIKSNSSNIINLDLYPSKIQEAITDNNGIAHFENVEEREHEAILSYNDYNGSQKLNVSGENKEQTLILQVKLNSGYPKELVIGVIAVLISLIAFLSFLNIQKS